MKPEGQGKIPVLVSDGTMGFGGARICFLDLISTLDKDKFQVFSLMRDASAKPPEMPGVTRLFYAHFQQHEIAHKLRKRRWLPSKAATAISFPVYYLTCFIPYCAFLAYHMLRHRIRVLHLSNHMLSNVPALLTARILGLRSVSQQAEFPDTSRRSFNRICSSLLTRHFAVSRSILASLVEGGVKESKIRVIYNGIDLAHIEKARTQAGGPPISKDFRNIGIFGRVVAWKGQLNLIKAVQRLKDSHPDVRLYIVGNASDGADDYLKQCVEYVREHGLSEQVVFTGYLANPYRVMDDMDVVAHCSTSPEPFGLVWAEAMALRKVVLASCLGAPPEVIVDGVNGFLADPADIEAVAAKLAHILDAFSGLDAIRAAGRAMVEERFELRSQTRAIEAQYLEMLES